MGELDYGLTPNVWRPLLVPDYSTGNDQGVSGGTITTTTETFTYANQFGNPNQIGWFKEFSDLDVRTINTTSFVTLRTIVIDFRRMSHLIVVTWKDPSVNFGQATVQFQDIPPAGFNAATNGFVGQQTLAVASGVGYMVWRFDTMLNSIHIGPSPNIPPPDVSTAHRSIEFLSRYVFGTTAFAVTDNGGGLQILNHNPSIGGYTANIEHGNLISISAPADFIGSHNIGFAVQAKMSAGGTSTQITEISYYRMGGININPIST
jgi:hypothetical protein